MLGCGLASSRKKREVGWRLQGAPAACRLASAHTPLTPAVILGLRGRDVDPCGAETVPEPVMLQPFWQRYKYRRYPASSTLRVPQAIQATCSRIRVPSPTHPCTPNSIPHPAFRSSDSHHLGMISVRRITDPSGTDFRHRRLISSADHVTSYGGYSCRRGHRCHRRGTHRCVSRRSVVLPRIFQ